MGIPLHKLIGEESQFSREHRILNIVLFFGVIIAIWSAITNYLLGLDLLLVLTCLISGAVLSGLHYLSVVKKQYRFCISTLIISSFIIIPAAWIFNGGISGSIPFYIILFSLMGATVLSGIKRVAFISLFIIISCSLVYLEYKYPFIIIGYSSKAERYIDILIGLVTIIIANVVVYVVILNYYRKEHEQAKKYLEKSRQVQENLLYLSYHDAMTGLYNRTYFEKLITDLEGKIACEFGVFAVDIDGLKFVNDTFGHEQGDSMLVRTAKVLQASFRVEDIIARIGGDEFAIIVKGISMDDMEDLYKCIRDNIQTENAKNSESVIPLQMSSGYAYSAGVDKSLRKLLREADDKMYREKLYHQAGTEGSIIQTVKKMLLARDYDTGVHGDRLKNIIACFAIAAGLPESKLADIQLFAEFHDVGKIGISDRILHKPGPLDQDEREQIQRHCEIGYRIAQTSTELMPIADWILKHHEWWNGEGYPLEIKGEQIPIECRIVAIADSYDAMTSDRPYRKSLGHEDAIKELVRCAGTQFDPELVKIFTRVNKDFYCRDNPLRKCN
ncbi:diguanylate cyclase (GGDEF)-like protein [Sporomusaceae bacterium BoRhaA]|uniref:bifunctional diguanylate cyclase/phosphohydrolase n=1 Tax=Pelorhabdus rhamnosifermentans TaxID=2772457 RepID=UPI001C05F6F8|nr:diguanylate cyclase [Pelorhabdus rhamnosifermentans]MBU2700481.1 diguanylate cyclase (GGDEF)-like protein [Pelorhabdus rhamnosifermentans]